MSESEVAGKLLEYAQTGNWRMLAATALTATVWFLRTIAIRPGLEALPKIGPALKWLKTDRGGVALALSVGVLGAVGTGLAAHQHISLALVVSGAVNGVLSAGIFSTVKKALRPGDKPIEAPPALHPEGSNR